MVRAASLLLSSTLVAALLVPARAEENPCERRVLPVSVVDKNGNPVDGLTVADFRGKFRGKPVQILSVEPDQRHRRIVILVDASGSMLDRSTWSMVCSVSADAYRHFLARSSMALLVFSGTILKRVGFAGRTEDLGKLFAELDLERQAGAHETRKTALWEALQAAIDELHPANLGDVIYVFTDAGNNVYKTKASTVWQELVTSNIRLFAFLVTVSPFVRGRTMEEVNGPQDLLEVAKESGGDALFLSSPEFGFANQFRRDQERRVATKTALGQLYKEMESFYRVEIRPEMPVDRPHDWKLEVVGKNGKPRRDVDVHYPQTLLPCRDTTP